MVYTMNTRRKTKKLKTKTWYNIRYKQTPIETDKKIKLEGWLDGTKIGEYIDDGNMTQDTRRNRPSSQKWG